MTQTKKKDEIMKELEVACMISAVMSRPPDATADAMANRGICAVWNYESGAKVKINFGRISLGKIQLIEMHKGMDLKLQLALEGIASRFDLKFESD